METQPLLTYLTSLGYAVSQLSSKDNVTIYLAKHASRLSLVVKYVEGVGFLLTANFPLNKKALQERQKLLEAVNRMNVVSFLCGFALEENNNLVGKSLYFPEFLEKTFSDFLVTFEADIKNNIKEIVEFI